MNEAAAIICSEDPSLLCRRKDLLEKAHEKVHADGYNFVKGKLHSKRKRLLNTCSSNATTTSTRIYSTGEMCAKRI